MFKKAANNENRNPLDTDLTRETSEKLKELKKICKKQQSSFWETRYNELRDSENDTFWNIWEKCDENVASNKNPEVVDGEKWEKYYSDLLSDINKRNQTTPQKIVKKKIPKDNSTFSNELINPQELRKILKKFKQGKSPGLDRISNEMIKCSFEILKNCFVKLFNLVFIVDYIPNIWCKGLITPVHKNGDPTEPDNFRPYVY